MAFYYCPSKRNIMKVRALIGAVCAGAAAVLLVAAPQAQAASSAKQIKVFTSYIKSFDIIGNGAVASSCGINNDAKGTWTVTNSYFQPGSSIRIRFFTTDCASNPTLDNELTCTVPKDGLQAFWINEVSRSRDYCRPTG
jgi:TRAP-type mannitol/chloroaromatic compound transport system substrate-binding protein